jgi:LPS sulfotransferase NodH
MSDGTPGAEGKVVVVADPAGEEERLAALRAAYPGRRFAGLAGQVLPALAARAGHTLFSDAALPPRPARAVILCASPRSGSSLVADVLSDMGCGDVREHLRRGILDALSGKYRFDRGAALGHFLCLAQVNGTFGTKLITHFVEDYIRAIGDLAAIRSAFAGIDTVWLTLDRTDKLRQAVSGELASRRGVWHNTGASDEAALRQIGEPAVLHFNSLIGRHLFYGQQSAILAFLNAHGRISLRLTYEADVAAGDIRALSQKLAAALLLEVRAWTFKRAGTRKRLADAASEDLVSRYAAALEHAFEGRRAP